MYWSFLSGILLTFVWSCITLVQSAQYSELGDPRSQNELLPASKAGGISVKERMKNETSHEKGRAALYCDIFGDPIPRFRWYKDGKLLPKVIPGKLKIKQELWGSLLKLENLETKDAGWYVCIAGNKFGAANTTAFLKVLPPDVQTSEDNFPPKPRLPEENSPNGFCQPFQSSVCGKYLVGQDVYVTHDFVQSEKEKQISLFIAAASEHSIWFEDAVCLGAIMKATCFFNFPLCVLREGGDIVVPKRLCREECQAIVAGRCKKEFHTLKYNLQPRFAQEFLNCSTLSETSPEGPDRCLTLGKVLTSPPRPKIPTVPSITECFNGTGSHYSGNAAVSWSGRKCLLWNQIPGFDFKESHNFCRNPNPEKWSMYMPWCFVSMDGEREACDVTRCKGSNLVPDYFSTELLPIFVSLGVLAGFSVILLLVCCFFRRGPSPQGYAGIKKPGGAGGGVFDRPLTSQLEAVFSKIHIDAPELALAQIRFEEEFGHGQFGPVYRGKVLGLFGDTSHISVAVKTLILNPPSQLQTDFRREGQLTARLNHPYLACLVSVCLKESPMCLVYEMPPLGDLHEFLVYHNPVCTAMDASGVFSLGPGLSYSDQLHIASQLASALEYLASEQFVHRDVATRNVLVGENLLCKLSDLALTRRVYDPDYYTVQAGNARLPIRWMPPEAILFGKFTVESDVWAYGVLLWEVWSLGLQPYYGYSNSEVIELVRARQMLPSPEECSAQLYALMVECWNELPQHRPLFRDIHRRVRSWHLETLQPPLPSHNPPQGSQPQQFTMSTGQTCSSLASIAKSNCYLPHQKPLQQMQQNTSGIVNSNGLFRNNSSPLDSSSFSAESSSHPSSSKTVIPGLTVLHNSGTMFIPDMSSQSTHIV